MTARAQRLTGWLIALALLAAAWFVAWTTPDGEARMTDPFPVAATVGDTAAGRNLGVTVHSATIADRVTLGGWYAEGTWLVVDLEAWARVTESPGALEPVTLVVGDRTFRVSERPGSYALGSALFAAPLHIDIPQSGSLAFELAEGTDAAHDATLRLAVGQNDIADSVIEVPLDLAALPHADEVALSEKAWVNP